MLQRQGSGAGVETSVDDPNFLVCMGLCYLGLPPSILKTVVELFLRAAFETYRSAYGRVRAVPEFRGYRRKFLAYSLLRMLRHVLTFAVHGEIRGLGLEIPVKSPAARALRERMLAFLAARITSGARLAVAEHILRKAMFAIELAVVAGCGMYCGGRALAGMIISATEAVASAVVATANLLSALGRIPQAILAGVFVRPLLVARATVDPDNWDLGPLPRRARADVKVLGLYLWSSLKPDNPDDFVTNIGKPLSAYRIPPALIRDIARAMTEAWSQRTLSIVFTPEVILQMTPLTFVHLLRDYKLLKFRQDPERIADAEGGSQASP